MREDVKAAYEVFIKTLQEDLPVYIAKELKYDEVEQAAKLILDSEDRGGRIHISGIGKPAHIAGYIASLLSSTGTPAYFLHGTEAVHGSCGQVVPGDVVLFTSNSGETEEMKRTISAVKSNGGKIIGITGNSESWLAKQSDVHILAGVPKEGGPLNRAPRMSILVETICVQALSVLLQAYKSITPEQYVNWHPSGKLGQLRENEI